MANYKENSSYSKAVKDVLNSAKINSKEELLKTMEIKPGRFQDASKELRDDKEIALKALRLEGNFCFLSERLRDDEEIVKIAVQKAGYLLKYASERLRDDVGIVRLATIKINPDTKEYYKSPVGCISDASKRVRSDKDLAKDLIAINPECIVFFSEEIKKDVDIAKIALKTFPSSIDLFDSSIFSNIEILKGSLKEGLNHFGKANQKTKDNIKKDLDLLIEIFEILEDVCSNKYFAMKNKDIKNNFFKRYVSNAFKENYVEGVNPLAHLKAFKLNKELKEELNGKHNPKKIKI